MSSAARNTPTDTTLQAQVETLFRGETLLLNAYGWWVVGDYALCTPP